MAPVEIKYKVKYKVMKGFAKWLLQAAIRTLRRAWAFGRVEKLANPRYVLPNSFS